MVLDIPYKIYNDFKIPFTSNIEHFAKAIAYQPQKNDVFISTYPKCGTTWVQHIIYLIFRNGTPAKDASHVLDDIPFIEQDGFPKDKTPLAYKYHLPSYLMPFSKDAKYITVARNPMDCCVSYYNFLKDLPDYEISCFDEFFDAFIKGELPYGDCIDHFLSWYQLKDQPNVLFLTYENMKKEPVKVVKTLASFLGKGEAIEDGRLVNDIIQYSSISFMRNLIDGSDIMKTYLKIHNNDEKWSGEDGGSNAMRHQEQRKEERPKMIRKGCVGDWRNYFSKDQEERMKLKLYDTMKGTGLLELWSDIM